MLRTTTIFVLLGLGIGCSAPSPPTQVQQRLASLGSMSHQKALELSKCSASEGGEVKDCVAALWSAHLNRFTNTFEWSKWVTAAPAVCKRDTENLMVPVLRRALVNEPESPSLTRAIEACMNFDTFRSLSEISTNVINRDWGAARQRSMDLFRRKPTERNGTIILKLDEIVIHSSDSQDARVSAISEMYRDWRFVSNALGSNVPISTSPEVCLIVVDHLLYRKDGQQDQAALRSRLVELTDVDRILNDLKHDDSEQGSSPPGSKSSQPSITKLILSAKSRAKKQLLAAERAIRTDERKQAAIAKKEEALDKAAYHELEGAVLDENVRRSEKVLVKAGFRVDAYRQGKSLHLKSPSCSEEFIRMLEISGAMDDYRNGGWNKVVCHGAFGRLTVEL